MKNQISNNNLKGGLERKLNSKEAADYIGMSVRELMQLRKDRKITYYKVGHRTVSYDQKDLDAYLAPCRVEAKPAA